MSTYVCDWIDLLIDLLNYKNDVKKLSGPLCNFTCERGCSFGCGLCVFPSNDRTSSIKILQKEARTINVGTGSKNNPLRKNPHTTYRVLISSDVCDCIVV